MLFGSSDPLSLVEAVFLAVVLYGAPLLCVGVYLFFSRTARKQAKRKVGVPDHANALFALLFFIAAPWAVIHTSHLPLKHALLVVLLPGVISCAIMAWQWECAKHAVRLGFVTVLVAVMSIVLDPRAFGSPIIGTGQDMFFLEPVFWLLAYGFIASQAASSHTPRPAITHSCVNCGYSRVGLQANICPECGDAFFE